MIKSLFPTLIVAMVLTGCSSGDKNTSQSQTSPTDRLYNSEYYSEEYAMEEYSETDEYYEESTYERPSSPFIANWDPKLIHQVELSDTILLQFPGNFSGSSYNTITELKWKSLYRSGTIIYGEDVQLIPNAVEDPWGEEGNLDETNISDNSYQESIVYISGIHNLVGISMHDISFNIPDKILLPGESLNFGDFTLYATGDFNEQDNIYSNYSLTLSGMKDSYFIEQEIVYQEFFDDAMINFYWIGDLDQDGIPDMLIDTSHKYSYSNPTLYLSSPCDQNSLVKKVAETTRYGC